MRIVTLVVLPCLLGLSSFSASAPAQPPLPEVIALLNSQTGSDVFSIDPELRTIRKIQNGKISNARWVFRICQALDNRRLLESITDNQPFARQLLGHFDPQNSALTTVVGTNRPVHTVLPSDLGGFYAFVSTHMMRLDPATKKLTTLLKTPQGTVVAGKDLDDNDLVVADGAGTVVEYDSAGGTFSTLDSNLGPVYGILHQSLTGHKIVIAKDHVLTYDDTGKQIGSLFLPKVWGGVIDQETGKVLLARDNGFEVRSPDVKTVLDTIPLSPGLWVAFLFLALEHALTGEGTTLPGSEYTYSINHPDFTGSKAQTASYQMALSFAQRPGIPLAGQTINLAPDALFWASILGAVGKNFSGVLDANGHASASLKIPAFTPPGITIKAAAVLVMGSKIHITNTWPVTIRKP